VKEWRRRGGSAAGGRTKNNESENKWGSEKRRRKKRKQWRKAWRDRSNGVTGNNGVASVKYQAKSENQKHRVAASMAYPASAHRRRSLRLVNEAMSKIGNGGGDIRRRRGVNGAWRRMAAAARKNQRHGLRVAAATAAI